MTLICTMLISVIGLSAIFGVRAQRRIVNADVDLVRARAYAVSALELGLEQLTARSDWRTTLTPGTWVSDRSIGQGTYSITIADPADSDLANDADDPVRLTAYVSVHDSRYALQANVTPDNRAIEALRFAAHAASTVLTAGATLRANGGGLSSNIAITNGGTIQGDAEAGLVVNVAGTITGDRTNGTAAKDVPGSDVYDTYAARARSLPVTSLLERTVLSPNRNPFGLPSADGVYAISTNSDLVLRGVRIHGTLLVKLRSGARLTIDDSVLITPARSDYPALIVDGDATIGIHSRTKQLDEDDWSVNFNPPAAPYQGVANLNTNNAFPNEIQGLVLVTGGLTLEQTARVRGSVLVGNVLTVRGDNEIDYDATLYADPPEGFYDQFFHYTRGSLKQVAFPTD